MEMNPLIMLVSTKNQVGFLFHIFLWYLDSQTGNPWLGPPSNYLPSDLAANHGTFTDVNGTGLPSMASFRPQQQPTYNNSGNEQTVQTGEALGKALQSVRNIIEFIINHECLDI
jgi:hypothetical protein